MGKIIKRNLIIFLSVFSFMLICVFSIASINNNKVVKAQGTTLENATTDTDSWWRSSTNVTFMLESSLDDSSVLTGLADDAIKLIRNGTTYNIGLSGIKLEKNGELDRFYLKDTWYLSKSEYLGVSYEKVSGDEFYINGEFSYGSETVTIKDIHIIINSSLYSMIEYDCSFTDADGIVTTYSYDIDNRATVLNEIKTHCHTATGSYVYLNDLPDVLPEENNKEYIETKEEIEYMTDFESLSDEWWRTANISFKATSTLPDSTSLQATTEDAIQLIRNGVTLNVGLTSDVTINKNGSETTYYIANFSNIKVDGESYSKTAGDEFVINGIFSYSSGMIAISNLHIKLDSSTQSYVAYTCLFTDVNSVKHNFSYIPSDKGDVLTEISELLHEDGDYIYINNLPSELPLENGKEYYEVKTNGYAYDVRNNWNGAKVYSFGLNKTDNIATGTYLYPTAEENIKITRNGLTYNVGVTSKGSLYKHGDNEWMIYRDKLKDGFSNYQVGDIVTISGSFTDGNGNYILLLKSQMYVGQDLSDQTKCTSSVIPNTYVSSYSYSSSSQTWGCFFKLDDISLDEMPYTGDSNALYPIDSSCVLYNGEAIAKVNTPTIKRLDGFNGDFNIDVTQYSVFSSKQKGDIVLISGYFANEVITNKKATTGIYIDYVLLKYNGTYWERSDADVGKFLVNRIDENFDIKKYATNDRAELIQLVNQTKAKILNSSSVENAYVFYNEFFTELSNYSIDSSSFEMVSGASVRLTTPMGIRFSAIIGTSIDENASYYVMIVPYSYITEYNITSNYYTALREALDSDGKQSQTIDTMCVEPILNSDGVYYIQGSKRNIEYEDINTYWFAVAYFVKDGVYTYAKFNEGENVRSLSQVASLALCDSPSYTDGQVSILNKYVTRSYNKAEGKDESHKDDSNAKTLQISDSSLTLLIGEAKKLSLGIPTGSTAFVKWQSSNEDVVIVDDLGNVVPVSSGTATITASYLNVTYSCSVSVEDVVTKIKHIVKNGNIISWDVIDNVPQYVVTICKSGDQSSVVYSNIVSSNECDISNVSLEDGITYVCRVSVKAGQGITSLANYYFTKNTSPVVSGEENYTQIEESSDNLLVSVWAGSYHFNSVSAVEDLANAGITLAVKVNPYWNSNFNTILDKAYELGVYFIVDLNTWNSTTGQYDYWDGTVPTSYDAKHPAILGYIAYDEPDTDQLSTVISLYNMFKDKQSQGYFRDDQIFYTNLACSGFMAQYTQETYGDKDDYSEYLLDALDASDVISYDFYPMKEGKSDKSKVTVQKSYIYNFDICAKVAKDNDMPFWYTLQSAKHMYDANGGYYLVDITEDYLRWQISLALAYGVDSVSHYVYATTEDGYTTMCDVNGNRSTYYDVIAKITREYEDWGNVYNNYTWQGTAKVGSSSNALFKNLDNAVDVNSIGGLKSATSSSSDIVVGLFENDNLQANKAFMITNCGSASDTITTKYRFETSLTYSTSDTSVTLTFDDGYAAVLVIEDGVRRYETLSNNQVTLSISSYDGVFVIPVKSI